MLKDIFIGILIGLIVLSSVLVWQKSGEEVLVNGGQRQTFSWSIFDKKPEKLTVRQNTVSVGIYAPILMYHYIRNNPDENDTLGFSLSVTPENFAQQLDWLTDNGYQTISLDELVGGLKNGYLMVNKPAVLTFDDGYSDFYTTAYPELKKRNLKATIYIITQEIDNPDGRFLSSAQIAELAQSGLITIGSHSVSHINFATASIANATKEAYPSKKRLEQIVNRKVVHFAYPSGQFNDSVIKLLGSLGYSSAVTTVEGTLHHSNELLSLKRVRISGSTTIEKFKEKLEQKI